MTSDAIPGKRPRPAVFLQDFVDVRRPLPEVAGRLAGDARWLSRLAAAAGGDGRTLLMRLGLTSSTAPTPAWDVVIRLGGPYGHGTGLVVPLRWEAVRHPVLFPVLDGDLELAPLGTQQCRIVLHGSCRPPPDGKGRWIDQAVLHRVAESTVRSFLQRVAQAIEAAPSCDGKMPGGRPPAARSAQRRRPR